MRGYKKMIVLKENTSLKPLVYEEGQLFDYPAGNILPIDRSYCHLSGIIIQMIAKRKGKAYCCTNVITHILSVYRNYNLCKNHVVIDSKSKIKKALADNITKKHIDVLMKNKVLAHITTTITGLSADTVLELDKSLMKCMARSLKDVYDPKVEYVTSQEKT